MRSWIAGDRWLVIGIVIVCAALHSAGALDPVRTWLGDQRFRFGERPASGNLLLVDIDAKSLSEIAVWPWPRKVYAELTDRLSAGGARAIAFDIDFSAASDAQNDAAFVAALERAGNKVLLAAFNQKLTQYGENAEVAANLPTPVLARHSRPAHVNVVGDSQGRIRSIALRQRVGDANIPAMAAVLAQAEPGSGGLALNYSIQPETLDRVSVVDVLAGRVGTDRIAGRSVLIGAAALELRDVFQVPVHGLLSGPVIQAIAAETIIQNRGIHPAPGGLPYIGLAALAAALLFAWKVEWRRVLVGLFAASVGIEAIAIAVQAQLALALDSSLWQAALAGSAVVIVLREIGLRRVLLAGSRQQVHNTRAILDQVVADNFTGILVIDDDGTVRAMSRRASEILACSDLTGRSHRASGAVELSNAVERAFSAAKRGEAAQCAAVELDFHTRGEVRRLEYTLTISRLAETATTEDAPRERLVACLSFRDVTEESKARSRLAYLARNDVLTDLANRNFFSEQLDIAIREGRSGLAVLFLDLDRFKTINDTLGHTMGDALLRAVGRRVRDIVGPRGITARFGGDEFAVFISGFAESGALALAHELVASVSEPYEFDGHRLVINASVGCAIGADADAETLIKNADTALYRAKAAGGNSVVVFDPSMDAGLRARQAMEIDLWRAFEDWQFELAYQPQVALADGQLTGVETLLRWHHPVHGYVSPADFIPVAEAVGLIGQVGRRILLDACCEVASWPGDVRVSVNVSSSQFVRDDLVADVRNALERSGLAPHRLELEITESLFIHDSELIIRTMQGIRELGVTFSIDDFGTGYSSLSYIRQFPVQKIKIDKAFITGLPVEQECVAIVSAVVAMANGLGMRVNAEGVETEEQAAALRLLGCDEGQGWLFGRPQPASQIVALLKSRKAAA